jgi:hypothetical protein
MVSNTGSFGWAELQNFTIFIKFKYIDNGVDAPGCRTGSATGTLFNILRDDHTGAWNNTENAININIRNTDNPGVYQKGGIFLNFFGNRLGNGQISYRILRYSPITPHLIPNEWNYMQVVKNSSGTGATIIRINGVALVKESSSQQNSAFLGSFDAPNQRLHLGYSASFTTPSITQFAGEYGEVSVQNWNKTTAQLAQDRLNGTMQGNPSMIFAGFETLDIDGCTPHIYAKNVPYEMKGTYQIKDYGKIIPALV